MGEYIFTMILKSLVGKKKIKKIKSRTPKITKLYIYKVEVTKVKEG